MSAWDDRYRQECLMVQNLCEQIGYGNVMDIASFLWAKKLRDNGDPDSGAFYPTILINMKKSKLTAEEVEARELKIKMLEEWGW